MDVAFKSQKEMGREVEVKFPLENFLKQKFLDWSHEFKKYDDIQIEWEQRNYIFLELLKMKEGENIFSPSKDH